MTEHKPKHGEWYKPTDDEWDDRSTRHGDWALKGWVYFWHSQRTALAQCPRCQALVMCKARRPCNADATYEKGSTWKHEEWHAETDYPYPVEEKTNEPGH